MNDVYYKIYCSERLEWKLTVVCLQWFDEDDYYQDRFMTDERDNVLIFDTEEEAVKWLLTNVKPEKIDPEYISKISFRKKEYLL